MSQPPSTSDLAKFLAEAKIRTYAAGGAASEAAVPPALQGGHQLEYGEGSLLYRDVYFGEASFAGQEVVYFGEHPIWSMCYAGGWTPRLTEPAEAERVAGVLRAALRRVPEDRPFRGPLEYREGPYTYRNEPLGELARFRGAEQITKGALVLYELHYCGGRLL
jgi:hypothetical protein